MAQLSVEEQVKLLQELKEGDLFEFGTLLSGLDGGAEKLAWRVEESCPDPKEKDTQRWTLHGFLFDVKALIAVVRYNTVKKTIDWSFA
jgi:hypothetical protein